MNFNENKQTNANNRLWRTPKVEITVSQVAGGMWGAQHQLLHVSASDNTLVHKVTVSPSAQVKSLHDGDVACLPFRVRQLLLNKFNSL